MIVSIAGMVIICAIALCFLIFMWKKEHKPQGDKKKNTFSGSEQWDTNTKYRVRTAALYLIISVVVVSLLWCFKPPNIILPQELVEVNWKYLWCFAWGLMGLAFRAWQWRFDSEPEDPRSDKNNVAPPWPAYVIDYPIIIGVNAVAICLFLGYMLRGEKNEMIFVLAVIPVSFYSGSVVKFITEKWLK